MKSIRIGRVAGLFLCGLFCVQAACADTIYVSDASGSDSNDGTTWALAKQTIQAGVDVALTGDTVLVTNGVYETGSRVTPGQLLQNRVVITNDITLRSVNGPEGTVIRGQGPRGTNAVRCVYMSGGTLIGFTVENGHTRLDGDGSYNQNGAGVNAYPSTTAVISNCVVTGNSAHDSGGTTWGTLYNCVISGNSATRAGGGVSSATVNNCAIISNNATFYGGGADQCTLNNCTLTGNYASSGGGAFNCTLNNSIAVGNTPANVSAVSCSYSCVTPLPSGTGNISDDPMLTSGGHIAADSPCVGAGSLAYISGMDIDGEEWLNPPSMGCDELDFSTHYVWQDSPSPASPYETWETAAHTIQAAVDAAQSGDTVVVTNGVYEAGTRPTPGYLLPCRVVITNDIDLRSVNGPEVTAIRGQGPRGSNAVRGVFMNMGTLSGFTVTNGHTRLDGNGHYDQNGAGVHAGLSTIPVISNCILTGNSAYNSGGATYGVFYNCVISGNSAVRAGGGVCVSTLYNCLLSDNQAGQYGGATDQSTLNNCTLTGNSGSNGGGAYNCTLNNCIAYDNTPANVSVVTVRYSCVSPLPSGTGNISADPMMISDGHISSASPCVGAGSAAYATGVDIDGEVWLTPPSMGCDETLPSAPTGTLVVAILADATTVVQGSDLSFTADIQGLTASNQWNFGDGSSEANASTVSHAWASTGEYAVVLTAYNESNLDGVAATTTVSVIAPAPPCTRYVWQDSPAPAYPYDAWSNAAHTIQAAVDAALSGDAVVVTNGVYEAGIRVTPGHLTPNRVVITNDITVQSVNGAAVTIIRGQGPRGTNAVRCVYMSEGLLAGFTITNGHTRTDGDGSYDQAGGGVNGHPAYGGVISNCILTGNSAYNSGGSTSCDIYNSVIRGNTSDRAGGGVCGGTMNNCAIIGNTATYYGGGADQSTLNNCTLSGNSAKYGGGAYNCRLNNCIAVDNSPANVSAVTAQYSCVTPLPSGPGNIAADPLFISEAHISDVSPCVAAGSAAYASGVDIDGEAWLTPPSMGCDETLPGAATGTLVVAILADTTTAVQGDILSFTADIDGRITSSDWAFGDGSSESNASTVSHAWSETGEYAVVLTAYNESNLDGVAATTTVTVVEQAPPATRYVWQDSPAPAYPYDSWSNAAHTIQAAVDAALTDDLVLVTNGVYEAGARVVPGYLLPNRVVITNEIFVESVNGPDVTAIRGQGPRGTNAVRCVYMSAGSLSGFTVTNGHTRFDGDGNFDQNGGGVNAFPSTTAIVSNCIITGNSAYNSGGAIFGIVYNCIFRGNTADRASGGVACSTVNNSLFIGNSATYWGGAADQCTLNNCTLSGNTAKYGGGAYNCRLNNCIAYDNSPANVSAATVQYSCVTPLPSGTGNIAADPMFISEGHISFHSPCVGAGSAAYATGVDIDGAVWLTPPSMGCDETLAVTATGTIVVAILADATSVVQGSELSFTADIQGLTTSNQWNFGDGSSEADASTVSHAWAVTGEYAVVLTAFNDSNLDGVAATTTVSVIAPAPPCTRYVWQDSPAPAYPYDVWSNAAHTIQAAVDAALSGDAVVVTNGVYEAGTMLTPGNILPCRVVITNEISVQSVNGPDVTVIRGQGPRGSNAVRCVYMSAGSLSGFTVTNGHTRFDGDGSYNQNGAGINAFPSTTAIISNCLITGNSAHDSGGATWGRLYNCVIRGNSSERAGGGVSGATVNNCAIIGNFATYFGGGADQCELNNCTLSGNAAQYGGGAYNCRLNNCIAMDNIPANVSAATVQYSCVSPLPSGPGNIAGDPIFISAGHISLDSPCVGAGSSTYATGVDIDGEGWLTPPSMGCDEPIPETPTGPLDVAIVADSTTVLQGETLSFTADIQGRITSNRWDYGDGESEPDMLTTTHAWAATGEYPVVLTAYNDSNLEGVAATVTVSVVTLAKQYTLTASAGTGGSIMPAGSIVVQEGFGTNFWIQASNGFHISRVLVDGEDIGEFDTQSNQVAYTFSTVEADSDIVAYFNSAPILGVEVAPTEGVAPLRVKFDFTSSFDLEDNLVRSEVAQVQGGEAEWSADGAAVIIGEYATPGVFTNILTVTDGFGLSDSAPVVITVLGQAPHAVLTASTNVAPAPIAITFSAADSTVAENHQLVVYEWDFNGDGVYDELSQDPSVVHVYSEEGTHPVVLRVTDDQGLQDSAKLEVVVLPPVNSPPVVSVTNQPASGPIPLEVVFTATASDPDGQIVSYAWDFDGDGTMDLTGPGSVVTQRYTSVGTFGITVSVMDNAGLKAKASTVVTAHEASKLRTWISSPKDGGSVWGSNVTVHAQTAPGKLTASVQVQYKLATSDVWVNIAPRFIPPQNSFKASWDVTDLIDEQAYDLRSVAVDTEGITVVSKTVTVVVDAAADKIPGRMIETTSEGRIQKRQTFSRDERAICILADGTGVYMPAESIVTDPTVIIEVLAGNTHPTNGAAHGLASAGANREISIDGGLQSQQPLIIEIPYADANHDGVVDGTGIPVETLYAYWYDTEANEWKRVLETVIDQTACRVRLTTYHLTEFGLFGEVSLVSPANGGLLLNATDGSANYTGPENLADGNRASYWRSQANPTENAGFTYGFSDFAGGILDEAIFYNTGSETDAYAKDFVIRTSMDGTTFSTVVTGVLAATETPESYALGGVTCRYVQVVITSGYSDDAWSLAEFSVKGSMTTDPDADGLADAWEMLYFGSFDQLGEGDYETDGLSNLSEFILGGNPTLSDTDADGMPDDWEAQYGLQLAVNDASVDTDGDRLSNAQEFITGTDPTSQASVLEVMPPVRAANRCTLGCQTVTGRIYRLYSATFLSGTWLLQSPSLTGNGDWMTFTNEPGSSRYFKIGAELIP